MALMKMWILETILGMGMLVLERVRGGEADETEDEDGDEWVKVPSKGEEEDHGKQMEEVKMGEDDSAMEYDTERIFTHLYAHLPLCSFNHHRPPNMGGPAC